MSVRMSTEGMPVPPTRRASVRVHQADIATQKGRYLADVETKHYPSLHQGSPLPTTEEPKEVERTSDIRARTHFLTSFGLGAFCIAALCYTFATWIIPGVEYFGQHWTYGESHATILEARVGHHDEVTPTLFIGFPRSGHLYLVEIAGGNPEQTRTYNLGAYVGRDSDVTMTLVATDVNGDGMVDLVITIGKSQAGYTLYNNGKSFQTSPPAVEQKKKKGAEPDEQH